MEGNSLGVQWLDVFTFTAGGISLFPGWETKILHALWQGQKKKKRLVIHGDAIEMYNALHLLLMLFLKLFGWYMDGFLIMTIA